MDEKLNSFLSMVEGKKDELSLFPPRREPTQKDSQKSGISRTLFDLFVHRPFGSAFESETAHTIFINVQADLKFVNLIHKKTGHSVDIGCLELTNPSEGWLHILALSKNWWKKHSGMSGYFRKNPINPNAKINLSLTCESKPLIQALKTRTLIYDDGEIKLK